MKQLFFILSFLSLFLINCKQKDGTPSPEIFPNCNLTIEETQFSYGTIEKYIRNYDNGKLVSNIFYHNGIYNSTKLFTYDGNGNVNYMLTYDSATAKIDTIAFYKFNDANQLIKFVHYHTVDQSILTENSYEYFNGKLNKILINSDGNSYSYKVYLDKHGNIIQVDLLELNNSAPVDKQKIIFIYDNNFNPYYHLPDFISETYFCPNNLIKTYNYINGALENETSDLKIYYNADKLPEKSIDTFNQGTATTLYTYKCK